MQGYPEEGGATEAPDAGASSGDFPAAIKSHFSPVGQHSGGAEGAASAPREARDARADGVYGALDLGTNNCRLLLARPSRRGFRVVDAFSRIIRLGEGVSQTGRLSEPAMARTLDALQGVRRQARPRQGAPLAPGRHRSLPHRRERRGVPRPRARQARPRHRDPDARDGGAARRLGLRLADRRQLRLRPRVRHRRRLLGADLARPDAPQPAARPPLRRTARRAALHRRPGPRCRSAS